MKPLYFCLLLLYLTPLSSICQDVDSDERDRLAWCHRLGLIQELGFTSEEVDSLFAVKEETFARLHTVDCNDLISLGDKVQLKLTIRAEAAKRLQLILTDDRYRRYQQAVKQKMSSRSNPNSTSKALY